MERLTIPIPAPPEPRRQTPEPCPPAAWAVFKRLLREIEADAEAEEQRLRESEVAA